MASQRGPSSSRAAIQIFVDSFLRHTVAQCVASRLLSGGRTQPITEESRSLLGTLSGNASAAEQHGRARSSHSISLCLCPPPKPKMEGASDAHMFLLGQHSVTSVPNRTTRESAETQPGSRATYSRDSQAARQRARVALWF